MVVSLTNTSELSSGQLRVFNEMNKMEVRTKTQKVASKLIITMMKIFIMNKRLHKSKKKLQTDYMFKKFGLLSRMKKNVQEFKMAFKKFDTYQTSAEDTLIRLREKGLNRVRSVYSNFSRVKKFRKRCHRILKDQQKINENLNQVVMLQNAMGAFLVGFNKDFNDEES